MPPPLPSPAEPRPRHSSDDDYQPPTPPQIFHYKQCVTLCMTHCSRGSLRTSNGWILFSQTNSSRSGRNGHRRTLRALSSCTPHAWATSSRAPKARLYTTDAARAPTFRHSPFGPPAQTHPGPHLCGPAGAVHSLASAPHAQGTVCTRTMVALRSL